MNGESSKRAREIVEEALGLTGSTRSDFLDRACAGDSDLRAHVDRILSRAGTDPEFLEPPSPEQPPAQPALGEFELTRELGRGGMGVVYLARQDRLNREVAVKVLAANPSTSEIDIERFHREARATASLRHPGIVQVFADGKVDDTHWFAMEYVQGHDLYRELELQKAGEVLESDRPFLPRPGEPDHATRIARLCADVADALQHAHEHGLVHRDVKPQNLLLQPDGRVQIGDFGLVRDESLGSITRSGEVAGTPYYMSPEQARVRQAVVDHRTDIYSLGVVLYELATHHRPFEGKTNADVITKIRDAEPRMPRTWNNRVPRDLQTICMKAMDKDPRLRYGTAREMCEDLTRFLSHEAIVARPPTALERTRRWCLRHRVRIGAVALVGAALWMGASIAGNMAEARTLGSLSVEALDTDGKALGGSVGIRLLEPATGVPGPMESLGDLPIDARGLAPGYYRVIVDLEGVGRRVFPRAITRGRNVTVQALARLSPPVGAGQSEMIFIEGGTLALKDQNAPLVALNGKEVEIEPFWLEATEVSNGQYREFLEATGHAEPKYWEFISPEVDDLPVTGISWYDARTYAEWAGKHLPSYAEWIWAARGAERWIYPWGNDRDDLRGNVMFENVTGAHRELLDVYLARAASVISFPEARTATGLYHMFGNVEEWTETSPAERTEQGFEPRRMDRITAGNAWDAGTFGGVGLTLEHFAWSGIEQSSVEYRVGFRCASFTLIE